MSLTTVQETPAVLSWARKGGFAVLDQGLFAGANFLVNILLARWLEPVQYGAFAVAYSVFLLFAAMHTALLTEPMMVFGAGKYTENFRKYLGILIYGHWRITGFIALILALTALVFAQAGPAERVHAFVGLAFASPFILLLWLVRRAFYVHGQPQWSVTGGLLYLAILLTGMFGLEHKQLLSVTLTLVMMGLASLSASLWLSSIIRPQWRFADTNLSPRTVLMDHWGYGRWSAATAPLSWVSSSIYYTLLPISVGLEGSAALRAIMNLMMPMLQASSAVSVVLLPLFVKLLNSQGERVFNRSVSVACMLFVVVSLCYLGFLLLFGEKVFLWFYDDRYVEHSNLLIVAGLIPVSAGLQNVLGSALSAIARPDLIFWSKMAEVLLAITIGLWLLASHGVAGAIQAFLVSATAAAMVLLVQRSRRLRHGKIQ